MLAWHGQGFAAGAFYILELKLPSNTMGRDIIKEAREDTVMGMSYKGNRFHDSTTQADAEQTTHTIAELC